MEELTHKKGEIRNNFTNKKKQVISHPKLEVP